MDDDYHYKMSWLSTVSQAETYNGLVRINNNKEYI